MRQQHVSHAVNDNGDREDRNGPQRELCVPAPRAKDGHPLISGLDAVLSSLNPPHTACVPTVEPVKRGQKKKA